MLHLLCTLARLATTSVAGGAALSYNQLDGADAASARFHVRCSHAAPLSSRPLGAQSERHPLSSSAATAVSGISLRPLFYVALPYLIILVLLSLPYYNWLYYWAITLLWLLILLASLVIIPFLVAASLESRGCLAKIA